MNNQRMKWDAEAAFKRIDEQILNDEPCERAAADRNEMAGFSYEPPSNIGPERLAQLRKYEPPAKHGRDIEALMRYHEAHKKPVGYWEDAPRGMKFGGGGDKPIVKAADGPIAGGTPAAPTTTPPADDEFEPVGTKVQIGDRITARIDMGWADGIGAFTVAYINENGVFGSDANPRITSQDYMDAGKRRILKRPTKPRDDGATGGGRAYLESKWWYRVRVGERVWFKRHPDNLTPMFESGWHEQHFGGCMEPANADECIRGRGGVELHGPERDALIAECRKAMGI